MTKIKRYFKLDAVGVCMTIYSIIIVAVTTVNQSQLIEKVVAFSYFALIILYLLLRLVFVNYEFSFFVVLGIVILPMLVFVLGSKSQLIEEVSLVIPICLGILMGVLTFVRKGDDIKEYKIAIAAVSIFWILSFINAADFVEVTFDSGEIRCV